MKRKKHRCLKCEHIPCIDLYRKIGKNEGNELFLYESVIKNKLHVPCEGGAIIYSLCQSMLIGSRYLSFELFLQCLRDLKGIYFLILTGHYRNSMQIMRTVIENWLAGMYWNTKFSFATKKQEAVIIGQYQNFRKKEFYKVLKKDWKYAFPNGNGKRDLNHNFLFAWLLKKKIITGKRGDKWQKIIGTLNRILHPNLAKSDIIKPKITGCPSGVKFIKKDYEESTKLFQDITTLLLITIYSYIMTSTPNRKEVKGLEEALDMIWALSITEKEISQKVIYSNELRQFISNSKKEIKEYLAMSK